MIVGARYERSGLAEDIVERSREIQTDSYSMSIGEMLSMHRDGELDVHPEFQRIFRWEDPQKWRLIESILLGIPVPTIFVAQRADGIWDVIDGVQRLSTILQFVGQYKDENGVLQERLALGATEYLPALQDHVWDNPHDGQHEFSEVLRRDFKRSKLDFNIVKKESDEDAKFDLFQRLNSGTRLSDQESRNCLLVMLNAEFYRWMNGLAQHPAFNTTVSLSARKEDEGFRQELVLRFLLQHDFDLDTRDLNMPIGDFITVWVRDAAKADDNKRGEWGRVFERTFNLVEDQLGEDAFRRWDAQKNRFLGPFSISSFEAVTSGVAYNIDAWEQAPRGALEQAVHDMWSDQVFKDNSGTGITAQRRFPGLVNFGREHIKP